MQQRIELSPAARAVLAQNGASAPGEAACLIGLARRRERFEAQQQKIGQSAG
jgi:hypothetical protein